MTIQHTLAAILIASFSHSRMLIRPAIRLHRYVYFKQLPDTDQDA